MSRSSRYLAFLSYLLSLPAALFVLFARRDDPYTTFHARQSLVLASAALVIPLIWLVLAWGLAWIPLIGPMLGVILFALVIATYVGLLFSWITGMVYSLKGLARSIPLFGTLARWPKSVATPEPNTETETSTEPIERTSPSDA